MDDKDSDDEITIDFSKIKNKVVSLLGGKTNEDIQNKDSPKSKNKKQVTSAPKVTVIDLPKSSEPKDDSIQENSSTLSGSESSKSLSSDSESSKSIVSKSTSTESHDAQSTGSHTNEYEDDSEPISINTEKLLLFMKKYWHYLALVVIVLLVVYMRHQASYAPITDAWAQNTISNHYRNQFKAEVDSQHPNLPDVNKNMLVDQRYNAFMTANKQEMSRNIHELSQEYKKAISYEYNGKRYVYLGDIDSYYWLSFARNIVNHGNICYEIRNGKCWDTRALAPIGRSDRPNIHPYMIAYVYKTAKAIGMEIPLMQAGLITPTIVAVFVAIAAFFAGYFLVGKLGGVIASIMLSFNSMYVQRSLGSDNDIYNLLMPLVIIAFLFLAIRSKNKRHMVVYALLSGLCVGFFKFFWESGWWNIFLAILFSFVLYLAFLILHEFYYSKNVANVFKNPNAKKILLLLVLFYIGGFAGFFIVSSASDASISEYILAPLGPLRFMRLSKAPVNLNAWPNVLTTVAEFNAIPLSSVPSQLFTGSFSMVVFFLGIFGVFILFMNQLTTKKNRLLLFLVTFFMALFFSSKFALEKLTPKTYFIFLAIASFSYLGYALYAKIRLGSERNLHIFTGILLTIWFLGTLYASTKGVRFTMLVVPPMALAIGSALQVIFEKTSQFFKDNNISGITLLIANALVLGIILILPLNAAIASLQVSRSFVPHYNSAWDAALIKIRNESQPDAIVNSWWDFGHWFKYTTNRGVTLDGATQNKPPLHWLGKTLLTDDERVARGILRMLDCGSTLAVDVVYNSTHDLPVSIDIINEIILLDDRNEIQDILSGYGMQEEEIELVLKYSHCNPPENYLITSDDMVGKGAVWAHFGSWDFYKSEMVSMDLGRMDRQTIIENLSSREYRNMTVQEIEDLYSDFKRKPTDEQVNAWVAPWPAYAGSSSCTKSTKDADTAVYQCDNGLNFDSDKKECFVNTPDGKRYPQKCAYVDGPDVIIKDYSESLLNVQGRLLGAAFYPSGENSMQVVISDPVLTGSMFTRLYYMKGHGLKYFDLFAFEQSVLGATIIVWKADWDGESKIDIFTPVQNEDILEQDLLDSEIAIGQDQENINGADNSSNADAPVKTNNS
jgi:dolichyl-phosphooligosaccharide-protein glycotransferase